jgi:LmbE family N-acetylglucosaminyl deacetylase
MALHGDDLAAVDAEITSELGRVLPQVRSVLVVCAHPDDESFGLGAALGELTDQGSEVTVLCFTHGEASTLGTGAGALREIRAGELSAAAAVLGIGRVELLDHPDGSLAEVPLAALAAEIARLIAEAGAELLLVFDEAGITGHPDHRRATEAALATDGVPVLAWALPERVARALNAEFGTTFVGRTDQELDLSIEVDRGRQWQAITCHASQSLDNQVLWRRLELQGEQEAFRWLRSSERELSAD